MIAFLLSALLVLPTAAVQDEQYFDSGGVRLRYLEQGEGEPLILIHGFAGNLDIFRMLGLFQALADERRVIALDARGHGKSEKPHEIEAYGLELVEDVVRLLDHLELERAHVVGYSMGGMITLKLATTHPERVASAVAGGFGWYRFQEPEKEMLDRVAASLEQGGGLTPLFESLTPPGAEPPAPEEIEEMNRWALAMNDALALAACARGFRRLELVEAQLKANRVPTLAIVGAKDPLEADVERLRGVMDSLEIFVVADGDHASTGASPAFIAEVERFLAAHPLAEPALAEPR